MGPGVYYLTVAVFGGLCRKVFVQPTVWIEFYRRHRYTKIHITKRQTGKVSETEVHRRACPIAVAACRSPHLLCRTRPSPRQHCPFFY